MSSILGIVFGQELSTMRIMSRSWWEATVEQLVEAGVGDRSTVLMMKRYDEQADDPFNILKTYHRPQTPMILF